MQLLSEEEERVSFTFLVLREIDPFSMVFVVVVVVVVV